MLYVCEGYNLDIQEPRQNLILYTRNEVYQEKLNGLFVIDGYDARLLFAYP